MNNENQQLPRSSALLRKSRFTSINNILPRVAKEFGLDRRMQEQALFSLWPSLVESIYASRSAPLYLDGQGTLIVSVENGSTAQELSFLKTKLLAQLEQIGAGLGLRIKGIRFDLKRFHEITVGSSNKQLANQRESETVMPDDSDLAVMDLTEEENKDIMVMRKTLEAVVRQLQLEQKIFSESAHLPDRIAQLVEKRLRLDKWQKKQKMK